MSLTEKQLNNLYRILEIGALFYGTIQNNKIFLAAGFVAMFVTEVLLRK